MLFGTFWGRPKMLANLDPRTLYLSPKYVKNTRRYGDILEKYYFHIWESETLKMLEGLCTELFENLELYVFLEIRKLIIGNFETWIIEV